MRKLKALGWFLVDVGLGWAIYWLGYWQGMKGAHSRRREHSNK